MSLIPTGESPTDETGHLRAECAASSRWQDALVDGKWKLNAQAPRLAGGAAKKRQGCEPAKKGGNLIAAVKRIKEEDAQLGAEIAAFESEGALYWDGRRLVGGVIAWTLLASARGIASLTSAEATTPKASFSTMRGRAARRSRASIAWTLRVSGRLRTGGRAQLAFF